MRIINTLKIILLLIVIFEFNAFAGDGATTRGRSMPYLALLLEEDPEEVSFTFTTSAGMINTLPAGATSVRITFNGQTLTGASSPVTFNAPPGDYTFTAEAMNGGSVIATMESIQLKVVKDLPLTVPLAFTAFPAFDTFQTDVGTSAVDSLIYFGTASRDRAIQYGGGANDLLSVDMGADNDWTEQYGGDGDDTMLAEDGNSNDYTYQDGGNGNDTLVGNGGSDDDWVFQVGGQGNDALNLLGGDGNDHLYQEGSDGNDSIRVSPGDGNDSAIINGGIGDDNITYDVGHDVLFIDTVSIDGGEGIDTLTVNKDDYSVIIKDSNGSTIYDGGSGGTTITIYNVEDGVVKAENGTTLFSWQG
jgi:Ca2+-binding RTX toxin-like protein